MPSHKRRWIIEEYDDSYSIREESSNRELFGLTKFQVLYLFINDLDEFKYYNYSKKADYVKEALK